MKKKCMRRAPILRMSPRLPLFLFNCVARELLCEGDHVFMCIRFTADGDLKIQPLEVPSDTITINRLLIPDNGGTARLYCGSVAKKILRPGEKVECIWDDFEGCLVVKRA
jgi:hypothetical protein